MQLSNQISPVLLENTYNELEKLCDFMSGYRGPNNNEAGKFSTNLEKINTLFDNSTWKSLQTKNGHRKFRHPITQITIEYCARQDPLDPGAANTVFKQTQRHTDKLYHMMFMFSRRSKQAIDHRNNKTKPDFEALSEKIKQEEQKVIDLKSSSIVATSPNSNPGKPSLRGKKDKIKLIPSSKAAQAQKK
jgi:hypothetical protein